MRTNIFKFNINDNYLLNQAIAKAVAVLKSGGLVVHPTNTCYGLAANIFNKLAVEKVYRFKGRNFNTPLSIIVNNFIEFKKYGTWYQIIEEIIKKDSKKMYTFVVPRKTTVPSHLNPNYSTVGIQIPKYKLSLSLLQNFCSPLTATSANISGMPNNYSVEELLTQLKQSKHYPDLILDGGKLPFRKPSSVIEVRGKSIKVLR